MASTPNTSTAIPIGLADPHAVEQQGRSTEFEWEITNDGKGHRRLAVLRVGFQKAGINYSNYQRHPTQFTASLRNEDEDKTGSLPTRSYWGLSGIGICQQEATRFSRKALATFAEVALKTLKERYAAGDTAILAHFHADEPTSPEGD